MVSGLINAWDVFVFPSGFRCYRTNGYDIPAEAQLFPVGHPNYRDEVEEMRKQVRDYWKEMESDRLPSVEELRKRDERRAFDVNRCHCPRSHQELHNRSRRAKVIALKAEVPSAGILRHT